ncbi:hypothetical protein B0H12DRAFT_425322 [Mycena haematopus]|nr:hypothetical protein B0H12DRAFT_425322 [Mycena haematopus]
MPTTRKPPSRKTALEPPVTDARFERPTHRRGSAARSCFHRLVLLARIPAPAQDGRAQIVHANRYSKEFKYRPAASPIITETLKDGRVRVRGAAPTTSARQRPRRLKSRKSSTGRRKGRGRRKLNGVLSQGGSRLPPILKVRLSAAECGAHSLYEIDVMRLAGGPSRAGHCHTNIPVRRAWHPEVSREEGRRDGSNAHEFLGESIRLISDTVRSCLGVIEKCGVYNL